MRAQEVVAFSRLVTAGVVESIAVAHDDEEGRDVLWAVVRRAVNGGEKRFVERLEPGFAGGVEDAFYVDCGVTFALGEPAKELSVPHLAGQNVAILADGAVMPERTVAPDGGLVLDRPARRIHVGLPYVSDLAPMPLEPGGPRGTSQTKRKLVTEVSVRFYETVGGKIGPDAEHLETVFSRTSADRMGEPVPPRSTDRRVSLSGGWDAGGRILIRQDQPLPMTVLLVIPTVAVND
jgi:hypothetical protein